MFSHSISELYYATETSNIISLSPNKHNQVRQNNFECERTGSDVLQRETQGLLAVLKKETHNFILWLGPGNLQP